MMAWEFPFCPAPGEDLDWKGIKSRFDWVQALEGVPQNPVYHGEGDVDIHTQMVLEALLENDGWQALENPARSIVFAGTLLHDVAKPLCTRKNEKGEITSRGHSRRGEILARKILWSEMDSPTPFEIREEICSIVRHHGLPLWWARRQDGERDILKASLEVPLKWVAMMAEADVRGRIAQDREELLDRVKMFCHMAREYNCFEEPFPFPDSHSRFLYFHGSQPTLDYRAFDDTKGEVILMSGMPGSGKDTWIEKKGPRWPVISLDQIRGELGIHPAGNQGQVVQVARERARKALASGENFIWNATNLSRQLRGPLIDFFARYKARIRIVYRETDFKTLWQRNKNREQPLPEKVLEKLLTRWQTPKIWEAHHVDYCL